MTAGSTFTNAFGASPIVPVRPSYESLTIAVDTTLVWPQETTGGDPYVAQQIDVTASTVPLSLLMPPANTGSVGGQCFVTNVGSNSFTVKDNAGNAITTIATTQTFLITLTTNATVAGTWRAYQMASTASSATAASLAGNGLESSGSLLRTTFGTRFTSTSGAIASADRATAVIWQGGVGTLTLDTIANLADGWYFAIKNAGTDVLTLATTGGATINGSGTSVTIQVGNSGLVICDTTGFNSVGAIISTLPLTVGGTGATSAAAALVSLGGSALGIQIFGSPTAAATRALLGLSQSSLTESSVSTNQILNTTTSSQTCFICTAALSITLPLSTLVTTAYYIVISATNGAVTLTPNAADSINATGVGVTLNFPTGTYGLVVTNGANKWYTVYGPVSTITSLTLTGTLTVGGNTALNGASNSSAGAFTSATLISTGTTTVGTSLGVTTSASIGTSMSVGTGLTVGNGLVVSAGGMSVTGASAFSSTLFVGTQISCNTLVTGAAAAVGTSLNVGTFMVAGGLVQGATVVATGAGSVGTSFQVGTTLFVTSDTGIGGQLSVTGAVGFNAAGTALNVPNGLSLFNLIQSVGTSTTFQVGWIYDGVGGGAAAGNVGFGYVCGGASVLAVSFFAVSDRRLKYNIKEIGIADAWHWVTSSTPVSYDKRPRWDAPDDEAIHEAGFIAQDQLSAGYERFVSVGPAPGMPAETTDDGKMSPADAVFSLPLGYQVAMLTRALQDANERLQRLEGVGWFRRLWARLF